MKKDIYLGIDVGSVSLNIVGLNSAMEIQDVIYRRTSGRVIESVKQSMRQLSEKYHAHEIAGCCVTGSARNLVGALINADLVKNEITAHATATVFAHPEAKTILEIGGEDSKIIILEDGIPVDFAMNTICAAGTGAFLDQLAGRLSIPVEELGKMALKSKKEVAISGRCTVFAESDMIFKQQIGYQIEDIVNGLCRSMVNNYLNDLAKGKTLEPPVYFQGGVAANSGIRKAFEEKLNLDIHIPDQFSVMGAYGAALMVFKHMSKNKIASTIRPIKDIQDSDFRAHAVQCDQCPNNCQLVKVMDSDRTLGLFGGRCGTQGMN